MKTTTLPPGRRIRAGRRVYYGWIIVAATLAITVVSCGTLLSWGVFVIPLASEFGWTRGELSGVASVSALAYAASIPLVGVLADKHGFRMAIAASAGVLGLSWVLSSQARSLWELYLFSGVLAGIGTGAAFSMPLSVVSQWFRKRRGIALGIASCGISIGGAAGPPFVSFLILQFGWRAAFAAMGALVILVCVPVAVAALRRPDEGYVEAHEGVGFGAAVGVEAADDVSFSLRDAMATPAFWYLFAALALSIVVEGVTVVHLVPYAQDRGLSALDAAALMTAVGLFGLVGRPTLGAISDRVGAKPVLAACLVAEGVMMVWLSGAGLPWMLYAFCAVWGVANSGILMLVSKLTAQLFGSRSMGAVFGGISVGDGIGFAIGPVLAGYLYDVTGTYNVAFLLVAAAAIVAAMLTASLRQPRKAQREASACG